MNSPLPFPNLTYRWRGVAAEWRESANDKDLPDAVRSLYEDRAQLMEACAIELDTTVVEWQNEPLTIQEAAGESGYSEEALRRAIRKGHIANAGRMNKPRIRRGDLPKKLNGGCNNA